MAEKAVVWRPPNLAITRMRSIDVPRRQKYVSWNSAQDSPVEADEVLTLLKIEDAVSRSEVVSKWDFLAFCAGYFRLN